MLEVEGLDAFYGDFQALFGVSLTVAEGETHALIGANGAGKSSLLGALAGLTAHRARALALDGAPLSTLDAPTLAQAGIALSPEGRRIFPSLTVRENLLMGANTGRAGYWTLATVAALFPILDEFAHRRAGLLSGGQQQMVAIGRALMANPRLLLLDEVSLGLAPVVVDQVYAALETLRGSEMGILLVEQDIRRALNFSDRFTCLLEGQVALAGDSPAADPARVSRAYFGED